MKKLLFGCVIVGMLMLSTPSDQNICFIKENFKETVTSLNKTKKIRRRSTSTDIDDKSDRSKYMFLTTSYYKYGKRTASGQRYNPHGYTAASKTLPFGTVLKLTNPETEKVAFVTINDRGPYIKGRQLDITPKVAATLKMKRKGVTVLIAEIVRTPTYKWKYKK